MGQGPKNRSSRGNEAQRLQSFSNSPAHERMSKRQRTAALQDAVATHCVPLIPRGLGVRLSSAAFLPMHHVGGYAQGQNPTESSPLSCPCIAIPKERSCL